MTVSPMRLIWFSILCAVCMASPSRAEVTAEQVLQSIDRGVRFLESRQARDGSWKGIGDDRYPSGVTSLSVLALLNSGRTIEDRSVQEGLDYLRQIERPTATYEVSLMISVLAAARDGDKDRTRILRLARELEKAQKDRGPEAGCWGYSTGGGVIARTDRSNGQFAVLGLRDASEFGIPIDREVWERARQHWRRAQNGDGGWGYVGNQSSTGSMTAAGISTLSITERMLKESEDDLDKQGKLNCCQTDVPNDALDRGLQWMAQNFSVRQNPRGPSAWYLYYMYGLERAGRLSGRRFFGEHDWYREGAEYLLKLQLARGNWAGEGIAESNPAVATSLALLFLSKGLSPVLVQKLKFPVELAPRNDPNWNIHRDDARNLVDLISTLPRWPKLLTTQVVDLEKLSPRSGAAELSQSPVLYLSGSERPQFTDEQAEMLQEYVDAGGTIFAVRNCEGQAFERGFQDLLTRMFGPEGELKPLPPDHPVYRSEYPLEDANLWGIDLGCRTPVIYSPDDLSCLWDKWMRRDPPGRTVQVKSLIIRSTQIGVNVVAYATGREPPTKLQNEMALTEEDGAQDRIERGFLQVAKIRHSGGWDTAPRALRNLLMALNRTAGQLASTRPQALPATDPNLFRFPLVYMHGRYRFAVSQQEREQLQKYLENGGVLFADSCCGSPKFDESFRNLMRQLFPDRQLARIPVGHELFSAEVGQEIRRVRRRTRQVGGQGNALDSTVVEGEPFLEGIRIDGRLAVIYSKYDISCALERQSNVACAGYVPGDALKIALNVVLYAMLQEPGGVETKED